MFFYNRRFIPQQPKIESRQQYPKDTIDVLSLKNAILRSLEHLSDNIDEIKKTINALSKKINNIEARQTLLENQIDSEDFSEDRISQSDLLSIKAELDMLKKGGIVNSNYLEHDTNNYLKSNDDSYLEPSDDSSLDENSLPVMPGSGFASITAEYLKNINKK
ncbi:MAG TPA: hypothetical protein GX727_01390 [Clostridium sp.]|jgi:hypothetical protein|nr:hypothetical protein [Clostridium sp.]